MPVALSTLGSRAGNAFLPCRKGLCSGQFSQCPRGVGSFPLKRGCLAGCRPWAHPLGESRPLGSA